MQNDVWTNLENYSKRDVFIMQLIAILKLAINVVILRNHTTSLSVLNAWFKHKTQTCDFFGRFLSSYSLIIFCLFPRNRSLCLPLLEYDIDIRYWIPKIMCGGIETYRSSHEDLELWLISR